MATDQVLIKRSTLTNIGDAIRKKTDSTATFRPSEMPNAINGIVGGGVGEVETLTIVNKQSLLNLSMPADGTYEDYLLDIAITPANAPKITQVIVSNPEIAVVVDNGDGTHSLRVRNGGDTTVTVTDYSGTISDSFEMHVDVALQDIYFPYSAVEVETGSSRQLSLTYKPHTATNKTILWESSNENLPVSQSGLVTASAAGHAIVSATSSLLGKTVSVNVDALAYENSPNWAAIQAAIRAGDTPYGVGSEITDKWIDRSASNKEYDFTWIVVHYGEVEKQDGTKVLGMYLMAKNALPGSFYFENERRVKVDTDEVTAQSGVYYYGLNGSTYTPLNLQMGDVIPHELYTTIYKSGIDFSKNVNNITQSGINWWAGSSIRQLLNSESDKAGFDFISHHITDTNSNSSKRGFLSGVTAAFLNVLTPIKIQTARNTSIWNGEVDTTYDRIFLPSNEQVYATLENSSLAGVEGEVWQYFKEKIGTAAPTSGNTDARKITPLDATSAYSWWLRSAGRTYADSERYINSSGGLSSDSASNGARVVPACVIC